MPFTLATFNTLDLFEPEDQGSRDVMRVKLAAFGKMLRPLHVDVLALQEVGSAAMVQAVGEAIGGGFADPVVGRADKRGIRNAVVSRRPILGAETLHRPSLDFPVFHRGDPHPFPERIPLRRAVPSVLVDAGDVGRVRVLCVHFKSRRVVPLRDESGEPLPGRSAADGAEAELRSLVLRSAEALFVRRAVDAILERDPTAQVAVCGDLNDVAGSVTVRIVQGDGPTALHSCGELVPEAQRFSVLHDGLPAAIDHVLCTENLARKVSMACFVNDSLRSHELLPEGPKPDSDHAPLVVRFG